MPRKSLPAADRFWRHVDRREEGECWLWTGGTNGKYGMFHVVTSRPGRRTEGAHRFSYRLAKGDIPEGMVINHLCITPLCVNPAHLELATYSENSRYGDGPAAQRARQETCHKGHPLDSVRPNGTRRCLTCTRDRMRALRASKRNAS